jgi:N-acetylmuramoyl-L-alanine amidase
LSLSVLIDPGHGGADDGCMWPPFVDPQPAGLDGDALAAWKSGRKQRLIDHKARAEVLEDATALGIAKQVALSLHGLPVACELTRYEDEPLSLGQRAVLAQKFAADLVISIHLNAHELTSMHGADLFHLPGDIDAARIAKEIASKMPMKVWTGRIHATAPLPDWRGRAHNVLEPHRELHGKPALLVECCYLTNDGDRAYVQTEWGRAAIVGAIRAGICRFGEMKQAA